MYIWVEVLKSSINYSWSFHVHLVVHTSVLKEHVVRVLFSSPSCPVIQKRARERTLDVCSPRRPPRTLISRVQPFYSRAHYSCCSYYFLLNLFAFILSLHLSWFAWLNFFFLFFFFVRSSVVQTRYGGVSISQATGEQSTRTRLQGFRKLSGENSSYATGMCGSRFPGSIRFDLNTTHDVAQLHLHQEQTIHLVGRNERRCCVRLEDKTGRIPFLESMLIQP